jgi:NTP pyrophosphatase (non-canonical NTP hydrolase)
VSIEEIEMPETLVKCSICGTVQKDRLRCVQCSAGHGWKIPHEELSTDETLLSRSYFIKPLNPGPTPVPEGYTGYYVRDDVVKMFEQDLLVAPSMQEKNPEKIGSLEKLFLDQETLMMEYGVHPKQVALWPFGSLHDFMIKVVYATIREVVEIGDELPWKWWHRPKPIDMQRIREEIIDLLHFVLELAILAGMDSAKMVEMYSEKNAENFVRIHKERLGE